MRVKNQEFSAYLPKDGMESSKMDLPLLGSIGRKSQGSFNFIRLLPARGPTTRTQASPV